MNLQYLKYAIEIEKTGSFSKAAKNLYMNQPNLSKAIKELETMIGVSLFNRSTKGVSSLTPDGRIFMEYAKSILSQFDDMKQHFQNVPARKNMFRVSIPRASYITEAFTSFLVGLDPSEDFYINFHETDSLQSIQSVIRDGYDLGVIRYRISYETYFFSILREKGLEYSDILTADSVILMNAKNPLAQKPALEPSDLDSMIEINNDDFAVPRHITDGNIKSGATSNRRCIFVYERGSQFDILSRVPHTFMRVSPMPRDVLERNTLVQRPCRAEVIRFKDLLIYRKGHVFGQYEHLFLNQLEQVKRSMPLD